VTLFQLYFLQFSAIYIILAWAMYLPFRANQPYFGPFYSMALGAYFAAYTGVNWGWPAWLIIICAVAFCVLVSLVPAFKLAGLGGFPMLIATLAIFFIVMTAARNLTMFGGRHGLFGMTPMSNSVLLCVTYAALLVVGFVVYRIDHSYVGRALDAVHFDTNIAAAMGIDTARLSVRLQLTSSAIGGLAGALYAFTFSGVFPEAFGFNLILYGMTILTVGGMYTMWGAIIAAPILWVITQILPDSVKTFGVIIYGALLIIMLLSRPSGVIDRETARAISTWFSKLTRRAPWTATGGKRR
jgi:branched-chain amino acid transport system permease protein